jgi:hypothetical protein
MINYCILIPPCILRKIFNKPERFFPDQFVISLKLRKHVSNLSLCVYTLDFTSEKDGVDILLYFFHSSPSVLTMLRPKRSRASYMNTGLGKRREVAISYISMAM